MQKNPAPKAAPQTPVAGQPPAAAPVVAPVGSEGLIQTPVPIPQTVAEYRQLVSQRSALNDQYQNAIARRNDLSVQLRQAADAADRAGIDAHINLLDRRILQLEADLATTGRALSQAPVNTVRGSSSSPPPIFNPADQWMGPASAVISVFVLAPIAIAYAIRIVRRGRYQVPPASKESTERLERMEQAVDAIAIEIERISEGQRFMTRVFAERSAAPSASAPADASGAAGPGSPEPQAYPALGAGEAAYEPVRVQERETVR